jgi:List-Bact-rpt repeat protein
MAHVRVLYRRGFFSLFLLTAIGLSASLAFAASVTLTWQDNSTDEDGFKIERNSNGGTYTQIASVPANTTSYTDSGVVAGTSYCYHVRAFNLSGVSSPSNDTCVTVPITTFNLNLTRSGTGSGSVSSVPSGISCGTDCSEVYSSGTVVTLTATPASGSTFAGWGGDADCFDGIVTMSANKSCIATFNATVVSGYTLTVAVTSVVSADGSGSGSIISNPVGINCGGDCSETYSSGTVVSLTPVPAQGSVFAGWSGNSDCLDGIVTMNASKSCSAAFKLDTVTLNVLRSGNGAVTSNPSGINCGTACSKNYAKGTNVTLSAKASSGNLFAGWTGGGCQGLSDCTVSLANSTSVNAIFIGQHSAIGIFRPATGEWFLDINGNGVWDGCNVDLCLGPFGSAGDLPVTGDWTGSGISNIGVFRPSTGDWFLDLNGDGKWDGCNIDLCLHSVSSQNAVPITGDWSGSGVDRIGELTFSGRTPNWYLDKNGDGIVDCNSDMCFKFIANNGDLPVAGDWNATGKSKIGIFRPSTGAWYLDLNGDGQWKNCNFEICVKSFGVLGDQPVAGDWTGNGTAKIGIYRPVTGEWFLDVNGNGKWDGSGTDGYSQFLPKQDGDLPVVGVW